jgi:Tfp pilus assembly protein PilX
VEVTRIPKPPRRRQRGDILLITLVCLLVCLMGLLVAMRSGVSESLMNGNNLARQKDVQVGDIALRQVESQIQSVYGGMPLETSASAQPWYRDVTAGTAAPAASYWANCVGNSTASARCASLSLAVNGSAIPYKAYAVVQPTGRYDSTSCAMGSAVQYTAEYYDIFIHVAESSGATAVNTETVFRICTIST